MTARNLGERVIRTDRACPRCGYNVRGLSYGALCPECGTPAIAALTGAVPSELDSVLSAQIRRASVCALSSILMITVGLGVTAFAAAALGFSSWIPGIVVVFALVIAALALGTIVFLPAIFHVRLNKAQRRFNLIQSGEVDESSAEFDEFREFDPASAPADGSALRTPDSERT